MKAWNVKHIEQELRDGYAACNTDFERGMWSVFAAKDVKRLLDGRKPTPGEEAILYKYGIVIV